MSTSITSCQQLGGGALPINKLFGLLHKVSFEIREQIFEFVLPDDGRFALGVCLAQDGQLI